MKQLKGLFLGALVLLAIGVTSCKKDVVFNQENYNNLVKSSFPVENIDPAQTWATMTTATAEVSINLDYDVTYDVGLYLENPIGVQSATRVYEKKMKSGERFTTTFSYMLDKPVVYVGVFDPQGRGMAQAVAITNGRAVADINTSTSSSARHRASEDASKYSQFVKTANDYLNYVFVKVNSWDWTPEVKQVSFDDMKQYTAFTDADIEKYLSNQNYTLSNLSYIENPACYMNHGDGKHYRIASDTEIRTKFHINATYGIYNDAVLYVEGKLHLNGNTLNGPTIVVANGGEIIVDGNTDMSNGGRFIVLAGGKITGANGAYFKVNNGAPCYNAGTIDIKGELNVNGSDCYNASGGSMKADVLRNTSGGKFTNFGKIEARTNMIAGDTYNSTIINGCHMKFTENAGIGTLTMLDNSRLDVTGTAEFGQTTQTLYNQSLVNVGAVYATNTVFSGPTANGEYAIVKTKKVIVGNGNDCKAVNNTYFDWDNTQVYDKNTGSQITLNNQWSVDTGVRNNITKYVNESTALNNFCIPSGECTGDGYNSNLNNGGGKPEPKDLAMRFLFEDNFPDAGDYDFNDCVFTVTPVIDANNPKKVTVTVKAEASGAQKTLGGAIRLVNVTEGMLESKACTKHFIDAALPYSNDNLPDGDFTISKDPNDKSSVVMLLFKDLHWVLNPSLGSNGSVQRYYYNTQKEGHTNYARAEVKTAVYEFYFRNEDDAKRMLDQATYDAFIVEPYNGSFWEVHTVQNGRKGALVLHPEVHINSYDAYLNAYVRSEIGNLPWAVMVKGDVAYPYEWVKITEAYPEFNGWAKNRETNTSWYLHPLADKVFK